MLVPNWKLQMWDDTHFINISPTICTQALNLYDVFIDFDGEFQILLGSEWRLVMLVLGSSFNDKKAPRDNAYSYHPKASRYWYCRHTCTQPTTLQQSVCKSHQGSAPNHFQMGLYFTVKFNAACVFSDNFIVRLKNSLILVAEEFISELAIFLFHCFPTP